MPPDEITGPYLTTAVLCQSVLQEATGHLSLIRLTDSLGVMGQLPEMQPIPVTLHAVVSFRAGFARGKQEIRINGITPSRQGFVTASQFVYFEGEDRGVNAVFVLNLILSEEGVYWFDVLLEGVTVTRMPLRILYQRLAQQVPPAAG
jgi:hypothetical protein